MYCSMRFYIDQTPELTDTSKIIQMFDLFARELGFKYDYIVYSILHPVKDKYVCDKKYAYNQKGINKFLKLNIIAQYKDASGEKSSPSIVVQDKHSDFELFSGCIVRCYYPEGMYPMIIYVDFKRQDHSRISFD